MPKVVEHVDGDWRRPVVIDDWGVLGYYLRAVKSDAGTWGHSEQDKRQRIVGGDALLVRWPDGTESREVVVSHPYTTTISDHGHSYEVHGERLVIRASARGVSVDVPINELWVQRA